MAGVWYDTRKQVFIVEPEEALEGIPSKDFGKSVLESLYAPTYNFLHYRMYDLLHCLRFAAVASCTCSKALGGAHISSNISSNVYPLKACFMLHFAYFMQ